MAFAPHQPEPADDPSLPPLLRDRLNALHPAGPVVPPAVDATILAAARRGFWRRRRFGLAVRWVGATAAAAAAVVVVAVTLHRGGAGDATRVAVSQAPAIAGDVDGNGRVDMLDAFVLARKVDAKATAAKGEDVNGDGVVDRRDVDAVAAMAVRLPGGGR
jgi:hypothetical protein